MADGTQRESDTGNGMKSVLAAFAANLGIAIAKFVAFAFTGSASMLAESLHSTADTGNQSLLLLGDHLSRRGPTEEHPFGFGRSRYFWAFVVALVLFSVGGVFSIVEAIEKLVDPHEIESAVWGFSVLGIGFLFEGTSLAVAIRKAMKEKEESESWWRFIRRSRSPELPVVLLEDSGALLGLLFAIGGLSLAVATGDSRWDAMGSAMVGVLLISIAVVLAIETQSLLIGESALPDDQRRIREALGDTPGIQSVAELRTLHLGPEQLLVTARVQFDAGLGSEGVEAAADSAHRRVSDAVPISGPIYIDPTP